MFEFEIMFLAVRYYPVSITNNITKVFDSVVRLRITNFMKSYTLLNSNTEGFLCHKDCVIHFLDPIDDFIKALGSD